MQHSMIVAALLAFSVASIGFTGEGAAREMNDIFNSLQVMIEAKGEGPTAIYEGTEPLESIHVHVECINGSSSPIRIPLDTEVLCIDRKTKEEVARGHLPAQMAKKEELRLLDGILSNLAKNGHIAKEDTLADYFNNHRELIYALKKPNPTAYTLGLQELLSMDIVIKPQSSEVFD